MKHLMASICVYIVSHSPKPHHLHEVYSNNKNPSFHEEQSVQAAVDSQTFEVGVEKQWLPTGSYGGMGQTKSVG